MHKVKQDHLVRQFGSRCAGCGHYHDDLQRGRPARWSGLPGRLSGAPYCPDCRSYIARKYDTGFERGWTPEKPKGGDSLKALLQSVYPVPFEADAVRVDTLRDRLLHLDLSRMTRAELAAEEQQVEWRAVRDPAPSPWLSERLAAIREERLRRGR